MAGQTQRALGWDPILIVSQIVSLQALHYLTLSFLIPPLLWVFAEPNALSYEGGAANVGMVMDWREMAGWPTVHGLQGDDRRGWSVFRGAYSGGHKVGTGSWVDPFKDGNSYYQWDGRTDRCGDGSSHSVGWSQLSPTSTTLRACQTAAPGARLHGNASVNHVVLTTYYSGALPASLFFWLVVLIGAAATVIAAEQLCLRREMHEGLQTAPAEIEEIEMGNRRPGQSSRMD
ncbi:hypothetical protein DFH11DRAFT_1632393 [Phellopilus nigrolimitatus]|nr:hypothetical protein DFH11DRAFT_1632393 [Phellopilus nigrolimitatus]